MPRTYVRVPISERFWAKVEKTDHCWLWTGVLSRGYGQISDSPRMRQAHRVSWELAFGPIPLGLFICHACDVKNCVRPDHLFLGTAADNSSDMKRKGRSASGERNWRTSHPEASRGTRNPAAVLSAKQVLDIRARVSAGHRQIELAREYDVSKTTICSIISRRSWSHL